MTHGNGPQVGLPALQAAATPDIPYPLDVLDAESAGMIGYLIERQLMNVLPGGALVAALLTQVRVDRRDPAFRKPRKPIGATYAESEARALAAERGWRVAANADGWQRVVASPAPLEILEARVIKLLVEQNVIVICTGGGGIAVIELEDGSLTGIEAVIDKDGASALLACQLRADWLVMLTDVDALYLDWGTEMARAVRHVTARARPGISHPDRCARRFVRPADLSTRPASGPASERSGTPAPSSRAPPEPSFRPIRASWTTRAGNTAE